MPETHHLAQFNVGLMRHPRHSVDMNGYNAALDQVLPVATAWPGFLWIMDDDIIGLTEETFGQNYAANISTWSDVAALVAFMECPPHAAAMAMREDWFIPLDEPTFVLWWVKAGHRPDFAEACMTLETLK